MTLVDAYIYQYQTGMIDEDFVKSLAPFMLTQDQVNQVLNSNNQATQQ